MLGVQPVRTPVIVAAKAAAVVTLVVGSAVAINIPGLSDD
jgi:hypothetical protein